MKNKLFALLALVAMLVTATPAPAQWYTGAYKSRIAQLGAGMIYYVPQSVTLTTPATSFSALGKGLIVLNTVGVYAPTGITVTGGTLGQIIFIVPAVTGTGVGTDAMRFDDSGTTMALGANLTLTEGQTHQGIVLRCTDVDGKHWSLCAIPYVGTSGTALTLSSTLGVTGATTLTSLAASTTAAITGVSSLLGGVAVGPTAATPTPILGIYAGELSFAGDTSKTATVPTVASMGATNYQVIASWHTNSATANVKTGAISSATLTVTASAATTGTLEYEIHYR